MDFEERLAGAVAHWKAVVRWITGSRAIDTPGGLPLRQSEGTFEANYLVRSLDHKRLWMPTAGIAFQKQTELNAELWKRIGAALAASQDVPIWSSFLDQAFKYLHSSDANGCILSCAIACETVAKQINAVSPTQLDGTPNAHPARKDPRMSTILSDWDRLTGLSDIDVCTVEIRELFRIRNDLMHSGSTQLPLNHGSAKRLFKAASQFVRLGEGHLYVKRGVIDPRTLPV